MHAYPVSFDMLASRLQAAGSTQQDKRVCRRAGCAWQVAGAGDLGGELSTTLLLEAGQDAALMLVAGAAVAEQAPRQLLAVELGKQVLVADVGQQLDHLLQGLLNGFICQFLSTALHRQVCKFSAVAICVHDAGTALCVHTGSSNLSTCSL